MSLYRILSLSLFFLVLRFLFPKNIRDWVLLVTSIVTIFWFQPVSSIRSLDYWLPAITLLFSVTAWSLIYPKKFLGSKEDLFAFIVILSILISFSYLVDMTPGWLRNFISPPAFQQTVIFTITFAIIMILGSQIRIQNEFWWILIMFAVLTILITQKYEPFSLGVSKWFRKINNQTISLAEAKEFVWIGFSYFSFRLIHVLIDRKRVEKMEIPLRNFMIFLIFPPAYAAGPIDTIFHFQDEMENVNEDRGNISEDILQGGIRISIGLFYKFILADSLALVSFSPQIGQKVNHPLWMWMILYSYAFRIFFDFAGYTHIALGISKFIGINLPENFDRPYLSRNITIFWNKWHMTLTQWIRTYFFNPLTRMLRLNFRNLPAGFVILVTQLSTMVLIGLWHGINLNYIFWGLWNGAGLFIHNRWTRFSKIFKSKLEQRKTLSTVYEYLSTFLTFNYIALGWVWFAMPSVEDSFLLFKSLFGF